MEAQKWEGGGQERELEFRREGWKITERRDRTETKKVCLCLRPVKSTAKEPGEVLLEHNLEIPLVYHTEETTWNQKTY